MNRPVPSTTAPQTPPPAQDPNVYLGRDPVPRLLVKFSVPCVLSMLVSALYNIVDQIFIGQGVGYLGNAATNVVYPFTVLALALALMIGDGCAARLSLSLGRGDRQAAHRNVGNGVVLAILAAVLLTAGGFLFEEAILSFFGVTPACAVYAREYMDVILLGVPFYLFTSALNGVIRADGSPRYAMVSMLAGAVLNLILDPVAIFVLGMGVRGAAIATVIGQGVSCLLSLLYLGRVRTFSLQKHSFRPRGRVCGAILQSGASSFITQIAIVIVMAVANNLVVRYGTDSVYGADIPLSVIGIVMKVFGIVISISVGIAVGGQPIVGYNYGAGHLGRVKETYRCILLANVVTGGVATLLFEACPLAIVHLFGSEDGLYNTYACLCFRIFLGAILLTCIQKASSIFLQSMGRPAKATVLSLARDVVFFVPALLLLAPASGVDGMLWAAPIADGLSLLLTVGLVGTEWRRLKQLPECELS